MEVDGDKGTTGLEEVGGRSDGVVDGKMVSEGKVCGSGRRIGMAGGWRDMGRLEKRKHMFIKSNMTGDVETLRR